MEGSDSVASEYSDLQVWATEKIIAGYNTENVDSAIKRAGSGKAS